MKKTILVVIFCLSTLLTHACEFCGCSTGNYFISPFPQFRHYFIGTRYTFRSFTTTLADDPGQYSKDFYQTAELWGGVNVGKRWQFLGFIPYNINRQTSDDGTSFTKGLGDITIIANYNLLSLTSAGGTSHSLWVGGGIKLPTGGYALDPDAMNPSANVQPGTGSYDFVTNAMYSLRLNKWTINATATYRINQPAGSFEFGNRFAAGAFLYKTINAGTVKLNPTIGLLHEDLGKNKQDGVPVESTGGHGLLAAGGLDANFGRLTAGFNVQLPVYQHYSDGQTSTRVRGMIQLIYSF